jgi:hypothetical protein
VLVFVGRPTWKSGCTYWFASSFLRGPYYWGNAGVLIQTYSGMRSLRKGITGHPKPLSTVDLLYHAYSEVLRRWHRDDSSFLDNRLQSPEGLALNVAQYMIYEEDTYPQEVGSPEESRSVQFLVEETGMSPEEARTVRSRTGFDWKFHAGSSSIHNPGRSTSGPILRPRGAETTQYLAFEQIVSVSNT